MSASFIPLAASAQSSPLCSGDFRENVTHLRKVVPPRWMRVNLLWALAATLAVCALTLLSPMDEYVTAPGEVRPVDYAFIFSPSAGILSSLEILDGQKVKKGQVLARLDSWDVQKQISQIDGEIRETEASLAVAKATLRKVIAAPVPADFLFSNVEIERQSEIQGLQQDYLRRLNELQKTGAASIAETLALRLQLIASESMLKRSQKEFALFQGDYGAASRDEASGKVAMIEAHLAALKSQREMAVQDSRRLEIVAPEDGVILATASHFPGEKVEAGTALFKLTDANKSELRLYASEDRVNMIQPGQLVRFRANNNPDRLAPLATGRVSAVARDRDLEFSSKSETEPHSTYRVTVDIEKEPYPLAVGATVQAEIVLDRRPFWRLFFLKAN